MRENPQYNEDNRMTVYKLQTARSNDLFRTVRATLNPILAARLYLDCIIVTGIKKRLLAIDGKEISVVHKVYR